MNKKSQEIRKYDDFPPFQQGQRFLELENYVFLPSKSKEEYLKCFELLTKTFLVSFIPFDGLNNKTESKIGHEVSDPLQQASSLEGILRHNEKGKLIKSYGGFTRRTNEVVFLLVLRNKKQNGKNLVNSEKLRFLFLNQDGRVIHVVSNLAQSSIQELFKFTVKHFRKLKNFFVVDQTCELHEATNITTQLYKSKITKAFIYISPFSKELEENSKQAGFFAQSQVFTVELAARANEDLNLNCFIVKENEHEIRELDRNIKRSLRFQETHDFIFEKSFQPQLMEKISKEILFTNIWLNNVFSWYFNITLSLGDQLPLETNPMAAIRSINNKIATYFANKMRSKQQTDQDYNLLPGKCFPDLLSTTKPCLVCRKCKPKFGCLKCSKKFKFEINLCIDDCFKQYHQNRIKYLQKKFLPNSSESSNSEQKSTSISEKGVFMEDKPGYPPKIIEPSPRSDVRKKCQYHHLIGRRKMIKKKMKEILKENPSELKFISFRGVKLFNFYEMEGIEINQCEAQENLDSEDQKKICDSEKDVKMEQENYSFTDSLLP